MNICTILTIFGLLFGVYLILEGIFYFGLVTLVRPAPTTEIRLSCGIIGVIFVALAILTLSGTIPSPC